MQEALDLRIKDARLLIAEEKINHPHNGFAIYLEHYSKCIELIATEDIRVYEDIRDHYESRMEQMDDMDDGTPYNSWLQAEMLFQTGLAQVKFGTRINGVYKMLSSYERIKDHRKKYPQFWQNQKLTGIYNIILENIPPFLRWAADIFGFTGDAVLGLYQMEDYAIKAKGTPGLAEESVLMGNLGFLLARQEKEAFEFMASQDPELLKVTLAKYLYSNAASFVYRNDLTLKMLADIHQKDLQVNFYALPYATGRCKLNHLELDAKDYLHKFLDDYSVQDYKKAACNRLSLCYLLEGNMQKYEEYRAKVLTVGQALRDRDNEAILESSEALVPHIGLLKARLLCDGGYFEDAMGIMKSINTVQFTEVAYRLEYHYRMGRILQLSGQPEKAIRELVKSYNDGKSSPYTFATRSALYLGKIYEDRSEFDSATQWYEKCIEVYSSVHTTEGVRDEAEKAIKRLKSKS
jgi:tetratricopeptide (TPR) repeat protein